LIGNYYPILVIQSSKEVNTFLTYLVH